jgi:hypothetical protein
MIVHIPFSSTQGSTIEDWSEDTRITMLDGNYSLEPRIAIDSQNNMHVVFNDNRHGPPELYYMKVDPDGNVVVAEKVITELDAAHTALGDLAIDSQDNVHIVWEDARDNTVPIPNLEIYYQKLDNMGNTLVDELRITVAPYYSRYPAIAIDSSDDLHIAWCEEMEFGSIFQEEVFYTKLDNDGNTIVDDLAITESDGEESLFPDIAVDSTGNVHIMWIDDRNETGPTQNQDYWYTKLDNNGETLVDDTMIFFKGDHFRPSISIDSNDMLHVICGSFQGWKGNTYRQIYRVLLDNNGNIQDLETRLTNDEGNASRPQAVFDTIEDLHLVWEDERHNNTEIYYMKLDRGGNILVDELRLTDNMSKSLEPQIAWHENHKLSVVWGDGRAYDDGDRVEIYTKSTVVDIPNISPLVGISSPWEGQMVSGVIDIRGWSNDSDGSIMQVEVKIDSGPWNVATGTTSWEIQWNTTKESKGTHMLYAKSFDGTDYSNEFIRNVSVDNTQPDPEPNKKPSVIIKSPSQGEVSGNVTVYGSASDSDGNVEKVQIKIDSGGWNTASGSASWSFLWDTTTESNQEHILTARAVDNEGENSESDSVILRVNNTVNSPPQVEILYPASDPVSGSVFILGSASDVDGDGTITTVQVKIEGDWKDALGTSEWSFYWDTTEVEDGEYTLEVRAYDGMEYSPIETKSIIVDNPYAPTLTIFSDVPSEVSGTYTISGFASDLDGNIELIEIQIDDGEWIFVTDSGDLSYDIDTTELEDGIHTINIRATDDEGDVDIKSIIIDVKNPEELPWLLLLLVLVIIIILVTAVVAGRSKKHKGLPNQPTLQTLKCPNCQGVFEADSSSSIVQCPNCGRSGTA